MQEVMDKHYLMKKDHVIDTHYQELANNYDKYLYYSPEFVRTLSSKMIDKLDLQKDDTFVDLCGGTGMYSLDIHKQIQLTKPSLCVDPFMEMLKQIPDGKGLIKPICMGALTFLLMDHKFDKVLIKEAIHHINEREELFYNIYSKLPQGGRLLLVHVPPVVHYPIFKEALKRAQEWHACPHQLTSQLRQTGFYVECDYIDYPHKIPKERYFNQVKTRFMSVLHSFSDEEMEEGLKEMSERYRDQELLEFIDHFDYLTAIKE